MFVIIIPFVWEAICQTCFFVLLLQKNGTTEVRLSTERGEYRMAALFLLIMLIITSLGCIFLHLKLDSCQSKHVQLVRVEGECKAIKESKQETTSEVARTKDNLQVEFKNTLKDNVVTENKRANDWKQRADKLEEERDHLRNDLSKKEIEYLKCQKNLDDCQKKP